MHLQVGVDLKYFFLPGCLIWDFVCFHILNFVRKAGLSIDSGMLRV